MKTLYTLLPRSLRQPLPTLWKKLTRPIIWPVDFGPPERTLDGNAAHYDQEQEVRAYSAQVAEGLEASERLLIEGPMAQRGRVLHVGCGAGREPIALAQLGYDVVGIDISPRMIAAARQQAERADFQIELLHLAAHDVTPELGRFDYVLTTPSFYTFIPTRQLRIKTLQALASVLAPGAPLFLSAPWVPPGFRLGPRGRLVDLIRRLRRRIADKHFTTEIGDVLIQRPNGNRQPSLFSHIFYDRKPIEDEIRDAGLIGTHLAEDMWELRVPNSNGR